MGLFFLTVSSSGSSRAAQHVAQKQPIAEDEFGSYASLLGQSLSSRGGNNQWERAAASGGSANELGAWCLVPVHL